MPSPYFTKLTKIMLLTQTEENYLKAIFKHSEEAGKGVATTNAIAIEMNTAPASVTDMLRRLSEKKLINYEKYKGVSLTDSGRQVATELIRKHRLWECFLVDKLDFEWDEIHDIAEQLEHVNSPELIRRLNEYLGTPRFDPHGDPIPDEHGNIPEREFITLSNLEPGQTGELIGLQEHPDSLMKFLKKINVAIGTKITVLEYNEFDESLYIQINNEKKGGLSRKVSDNLLMKVI